MSVSARFVRSALETLHTSMAADVLLMSPESGWDTIAASRFRPRRLRVDVPALDAAAVGINYGPPIEFGRAGHAQRASLKPGNLAIVAPGHRTQCECDRPADLVVVCLATAALERAVRESTRCDPRSLELVPAFAIRDLVLERITHQLLREIVHPEPGTRLRLQVRASELALRLIRAHSNLGHRVDRQARTIAPHKLRRVKDYICTHLAHDLSLAEVAAVADMTMFHFAKAFRHATGSAPHRYVTEHRILRGRTLLHDRSLSIRTVARTVGFTHSHFTRLFTRHMGMTPSAFRELL